MTAVGTCIRGLLASAVRLGLCLSALSCEQGLTVPSYVGNRDDLVQSLRAQGLNVSVGSEMDTGCFSVPGRRLSVSDAVLYVFEYATPADADANTALITPDGQPNPQARFSWVSTPRFYREGRLIVLYGSQGATSTTAII